MTIGGQCNSCAVDHHQWSVPSWEDHPSPEWERIRLYRWECLCRICHRHCQARRTQIELNPPLEHDVDLTVIIRTADNDGALPRRDHVRNYFAEAWPAPPQDTLDRLGEVIQRLGDL